MNTENPISRAIKIVGLQPLARAVGVTYQSVKKWERKGMPRTEWTGETNYSAMIEALTSGQVTRADLIGYGRHKAA